MHSFSICLPTHASSLDRWGPVRRRSAEQPSSRAADTYRHHLPRTLSSQFGVVVYQTPSDVFRDPGRLLQRPMTPLAPRDSHLGTGRQPGGRSAAQLISDHPSPPVRGGAVGPCMAVPWGAPPHEPLIAAVMATSQGHRPIPSVPVCFTAARHYRVTWRFAEPGRRSVEAGDGSVPAGRHGSGL